MAIQTCKFRSPNERREVTHLTGTVHAGCRKLRVGFNSLHRGARREPRGAATVGTSGSGVLAGARGRAGTGTLGRGPSRVAAHVAVRPVKFVGREWMGGSDSPR